MPWKSDQQRKWGNSPAGHAALGDKGVSEWNSASKGARLPARAPKPKRKTLGERIGEKD